MIAKFFNWEQLRNINCQKSEIKNGDVVVVDHKWGGLFLAEVMIVDKNIEREDPVGEVVRKATAQDREIILNNKNQEKEILLEIKEEVRKANLPMKIIQTELSLDGRCLIVVFSADGRIDFREIVKKLSENYQKIVRFQQVGSRDEARNIGGYGICGREVCCRKFPGILKSISTDMADEQLISHRGSERLSGLCGRLMCCLAFEVDQYHKLKDNQQKSVKNREEKGKNKKKKGKEGNRKKIAKNNN